MNGHEPDVLYESDMNVIERNAVRRTGLAGAQPIVFVHGFGCDQQMWRDVAPHFEASHDVVAYDLTGSGRSDVSAYDRVRHGTLSGHGDDLIEILAALDLSGVILIGHSVGGAIAVLAANGAPERVAKLVLVGPSPSYIDEGDYHGGFSAEDIEELLETVETNFLGWSRQMAPALMGMEQSAEKQERLAESFCRNEPHIAKHFARVTFEADMREPMSKVAQPTLILFTRDDPVVPQEVGPWFGENMRDATLVQLDVDGHCPHVSAPTQTLAAIEAYLR